MASLVDTVKQDIIQAIEDDQLTLPTLPEVALKVRDVAEDPEAVISDLANIISQDPALTARIIRVTNSPLLRAPQEVKDLNMAISRLGMNYTANLAIGLAMEQMFQATSDIIDTRMRDIWTRTSKVASFCYVIAQEHTQIPPDEATLAALVHQLGALPILTYAEEHDDLIRDGISLDQLINKLHAPLGGIILKKWDFPQELINLPKMYQKLDSHAEKVGYAEIVRVANLMYYQDLDHPWAKVDWSKVPAFSLLKLPADPENDVIKSIMTRVNESQGVFG